MSKKIVVIGDLHVRDEEPFFIAAKKFMGWFCDSEYNSSDVTLVFTGDIVHKPVMTGNTVRSLIETFFVRLAVESTYILQGNHDYDRKRGSALEIFRSGAFPSVTVIDNPTKIEIDNTSICFLPYFYPNSLPGLSTMKEVYGEYTEDADHIIGHFGDETIPFLQEADISHMKGVRTFGHIHNAVNENYVGTPYITRKDESGKDSRIAVIDTMTKKRAWVAVPKFLDYAEVEFGDTPVIEDGVETILSIRNAPSNSAAREEYANYYIGTIVVKSLINRSVLDSGNVEGTTKSIPEYFNEFVVTNEVSEGVREKIRRVIAWHTSTYTMRVKRL